MLRCTIELVPHGREELKRPIGVVEITNVGGTVEKGNYLVLLKKCPPFRGALKDVWRRGEAKADHQDEEVLMGGFEGFDRLKRGPYDILYRALRACGLDKRNP